eukprot:3878791-Pyramimonas_sp.AAC.1
MLPKQVMAVFPDCEMPRLLLGREALLLQGSPSQAIGEPMSKFAESAMMDIAGNMVSLPIRLAFMMATFAP